MPIDTPTTAAIRDDLLASLESALNQIFPLLPLAFNRVLAAALAGIYVQLYKYGGWIALQMFVATASFSPVTIFGRTFTPLIELGRRNGTGDPTPATPAQLNATVTVINQTGTLEAGTPLLGVINGVTYLTQSSVALNAPTVPIVAAAVADQSGGDGSGTIGNLSPGDELQFANPLANIERLAIVDSQETTGADGEREEVYRDRVQQRQAFPPQGGASSDYVIWATSVAGIVNAYPYTGDPGQVDVFSEADSTSSQPDGIPTQAQLDDVAAAIELETSGLASRRPVGAFVNSLPITRTGFTVTVGGLIVDNPSSVVADIDAALTAFFLSVEPFVEGATLRPRQDTITRTRISGIVEDIVTAAGGTFQSVTMQTDGGPLDVYVLGEGEKAKLASLVAP